MLKIEVLGTVETLRHEIDAWRAIAGGVPFRDPDWVLPWWDHLGGPHTPAMVTARDDAGTLRGLMPLYRRHGGRTLAAMGDGNTCSDHLTVLAAADECVEVARQIGAYLGQIACDPNLGWDVIDFDGAVEGDPSIAAWIDGLRSAGCATHASSRMSLWVKPKDASWDEHLKHHGKTQRRRMRQWCNIVQKNIGVQLVTPTSSEQASEAVSQTIAVHQKRWNEVGQPGSFADASTRQFIEQAFLNFYRRGKTYLPRLFADDKVVAGELSLIGDNQVMYCYSSGYDTAAEELEPGRLLCISALDQMYSSDIVAVDFMRGDEAYKDRFATDSRRVYEIRVFAPSWMPRLKHVAYWTGFELKQWMRRRTGRRALEVGVW
jgi:CelD/BcsL family acetyltransferase involved in cellulose biosynthesis